MARILVVDDAAFMRLMLKNHLQKHGHVVVGEATNGQEAIDRYDELNPDLVTMDITMPEVDGVGAVTAIRAKHPDAKIIMCSAMGQTEMVMSAIRAGAKDFIVKPFDEDRVVEAVRKALG